MAYSLLTNFSRMAAGVTQLCLELREVLGTIHPDVCRDQSKTDGMLAEAWRVRWL